MPILRATTAALKNSKKVKIIAETILSIFAIFVIFIISLLASLAKEVEVPHFINLPKGSAKSIIAFLDNQNFNVTKFDPFILRFLGHAQSGLIEIKSKNGVLTRLDFLHAITKAKAATTNITLIPGETSEIFLRQVAQKLNLDLAILREEFFSRANEGELAPQTYNVALGFSEAELVEFLLNRSNAIRAELKNSVEEAAWQRALVVASIVQKEAADESEFGIVSGVVYNRLAKNMPLQMDGTLNYGNYSHERVTPQRIAQDNSEFNTYKRVGLPPLPVCNPSNEAIYAALNPTKSNYLYFVRDLRTGKHSFSATYNSHKDNINQNNRYKRQKSNLKEAK